MHPRFLEKRRAEKKTKAIRVDADTGVEEEDASVDASDDECADAPCVRPNSLITETPIEELEHPVLLAKEGEDSVVYDLDELVKVLQTAGPWPSARPAPACFPHLAAVRARRLPHTEVGFGPLTRVRFTSADIAPVRIIGSPGAFVVGGRKRSRTAATSKLEATANRLLHRLVLDGFVDRARMLVVGLNADPLATDALVTAMRVKDTPMIQALLCAPRPRDQPSRLLAPHEVLAASDGDEELLKELLQKGGVVDATACDDEGRSALALPDLSLECMKALRVAGAHVNPTTGDPPLSVAVRGGRTRVVRYLLQQNAMSDSCDRNPCGCTPMHMAVEGGHVEIVALLIEAGAAGWLHDNDSCSVLHYAVRANRGVNVMRPIQQCASRQSGATELDVLDGLNLSGASPLHIATLFDYERSVAALIELKACVAICDRPNGNTALHIAAAEGHEGVMRLLLQGAGVDAALDMHNCRGLSPLVVAFEGNEYEVFAQLLVRMSLERRKRCHVLLAKAMRLRFWHFARVMVDNDVPLVDATTKLSILHPTNNSDILDAIASHSGRSPQLAELIDAMCARVPNLLQAPLQAAYRTGDCARAHVLLDVILPRLSPGEATHALSYAATGGSRQLLHDIAVLGDLPGFTLLDKHARRWLIDHINDEDYAHGATPLCFALAALVGPHANVGGRLLRNPNLRDVVPALFSELEQRDASQVSTDIGVAREMVRALLALGANASHMDDRGFSPLHYWMMGAAMAVPTRRSLDDYDEENVLSLRQDLAEHGARIGSRIKMLPEIILARIDNDRITQAWEAVAAA